MPPNSRPYITDGTVTTRGKWTPKRSAKPARGTTHRRTKRASTGEMRAAVYATWPVCEARACAFAIPIRVVSEANVRGSWQTVDSRKCKQQRAVHDVLAAPGHRMRMAAPVVVRLIRVGTRPLDDDNLRGAFKHVRDEIARWLMTDDGSDAITWDYEQRRGKGAVFVDVIRRTDAMLRVRAENDQRWREAVGL
jgi:hypothetical protein